MQSDQWEFQDPKMEVVCHIRPYFGGISPYIGLTKALHPCGGYHGGDACALCIRKAQGGQGTTETGTYGARGAGGAIGRLGGRSFDQKPWEKTWEFNYPPVN